MFGAEPGDLSDDEVSDALGELTNMVGGNIKSLLPAPSQLSLPSVAAGESCTVRVPGAVRISRSALLCGTGPRHICVWKVVTVKILIVDDSKAMRMIVTRTLRQAGYGDHTFLEGVDGAEGLPRSWPGSPTSCCRTGTCRTINGIEFLRALRERGRRPLRLRHLRVHRRDAETAREAGALFLIAKPFTADTFAEQLGACSSATGQLPAGRGSNVVCVRARGEGGAPGHAAGTQSDPPSRRPRLYTIVSASVLALDLVRHRAGPWSPTSSTALSP